MGEKLNGKKALVTGGSRGIGRAICEALARQGAFIYINYASRAEAAEETLQRCKALGGDGEILKFNVGSSEEVATAFEKIKSQGGLDILVNNAGVTGDGLLLRMKDDDWQNVININLNGAFYCIREASKLMTKARYGRIINISSVVGEMGNAGQSSYVASKAGLIGLTKSVAKELAARSITCNAITPGFIETDMTEVLDEKLKNELLSRIPLARFAAPAEVASLVAFLSNDESAYITGQVIGVNGGLHM